MVTIFCVKDSSGARHCEVQSNLDEEIALYLAMTAGTNGLTRHCGKRPNKKIRISVFL